MHMDDAQAVADLTGLADCVLPIAIRLACDLRLADHLAAGPRSVDDLAARTATRAEPLHRLLRALAARDIFTETEPGRYALTRLAQPMRADHPFSLRAAYPLLAADLRAFGTLTDCLRTGAPSFPVVHGTDYWSYLGAHPDDSRQVDEWMASLNKVHLRTVLPAYDWASAGTVVDVGGGNGAFLAGLLARHESMRAVLVDLAHVVAAAPAVLAEAGVADRCEIVAGSFFAELPSGADRYVVKTVLPGWADPEAVTILRTIRAAMRPDSRLVLLEAIIPEGDTFDVAKLVDVHTMVLTGGRHRGRAELAELLAQAGLRLSQCTPTPTLTVIEASIDNNREGR